MKHFACRCVAVVGTSILWCSLASAAPDGAADAPGAAPPAHRGFQLALRTGYSVPFGDVAKGEPMSDWFRGQVPFIIDVGGKPWEHLFVGAVFGVSGGGSGDFVKDYCDSCSAVGVRLGAEVLFSFLPGGKVDPWLGYGFGLEYNSVGDDTATVGFSGFEPAILTGGVDFRLTRVFGLGPFIGLSVGRYSEASVSDEDDDSGFQISEEIDDRATHEWLTLGLRCVFFP